MALYRLSFCWCVDIGFWSITFAGMHWFHWKFAEGYIIVKYRSSSILVLSAKFWLLCPFFNLVFVGVMILVSDLTITFARIHWFYWKFAEVYIIVRYRSSSILVIICKILARLWPFFDLLFVGVLILVSALTITFAGMHWFKWKFAEGYIIVRYRSSLILVIICKILAKIWPFFNLFFIVGVKYKVKILFPLNNFWRDALISFEVCNEGLPVGIGVIIRTSVFFLFHSKGLAL